MHPISRAKSILKIIVKPMPIDPIYHNYNKNKHKTYLIVVKMVGLKKSVIKKSRNNFVS